MKDIKKQAEEYAELELQVMKFDAMDLKEKFIKAVLYGVKLASQWNSPDETPKLINLVNSDWLLIKRKGKVLYGRYINSDYDMWEEVWGRRFDRDDIDGWQYLPNMNNEL